MVDRSSDLPFEVVQARLADFSQTEGRVADEGYRVVHVRGQRMRTTTELFAEFAAAFQFPWYFGQNWAAFDECMTDLDDWLPPVRRDTRSRCGTRMRPWRKTRRPWLF
ncbi:hypothetical protein F5X71_09020 [Nocardia brasiliensis]|uniref:Barstar (barnase inhibitor) domain-containing protein n=1 Tax=Nocardia brasiliensis TaxID=37326 RepID=A0A6G9XNG0_NOCBR|nr:barstar family protein [Nocardia brasiliensis]QIS02446.1 hypothetical protein F5X71_09020 [Nocardia brasiliensis]